MNLGVQYISPLLPTIRTDMHLDAVQVGWLVAAYSLPSLLVTVPLGILADMWGGKRVLVVCSLLFGVTGVASIWASTFSELLALRVLQGIGNAAMASLTISLLAEGLSPEEQALSQGYRVAVSSGAEFVLPILAGFVLLWSGSWRFAFAAFGISIIVGVWALFGLEEERRSNSSPTGRTEYGKELGRTMVSPAILGVTAGGFARWAIKYGFFAYIPLFLASEVHASTAEIGLIVGIPGLLSALAATQAGRFGLAQRGKTALVVALVVLGAALPALTITHSVLLVVAIAVVFGAADGICGPLLNAYISHLPPRSVRTAVVSISGLTRNVGKSAAPLVAGAVLVASGQYTAAMATVGVVGVLAVAYLFPFRTQPSPDAESLTSLKPGSSRS